MPTRLRSTTSFGRDPDGTWCLSVHPDLVGPHSVAVPRHVFPTHRFEEGDLVRLLVQNGDTQDCHAVLWRLVAWVGLEFGATAVFVPTDLPHTVPSASAYRVEQAQMGQRFEHDAFERQRMAS